MVATARTGLDRIFTLPIEVALVAGLVTVLPLVRPRPAIGTEVVVASAASDIHIAFGIADVTGKTGPAITLQPRAKS